MGFDLYQEPSKVLNLEKSLMRRTIINFSELNYNGPSFFGARPSIMEKNNDLMSQNSGIHNTVGRHAAGFLIKGNQLKKPDIEYWEHLEAIRHHYIREKQYSKFLFSEREFYWRTLGRALFMHSISPIESSYPGFDRVDAFLELILTPIGTPLFAFTTLLQVLYDAAIYALSLFAVNEQYSLKQYEQLKSHSNELGFSLFKAFVLCS
jgi:hypothetical protein